MTFQAGPAARVLIGLLRASAYTRSLSAQASTDMLDVTTIENGTDPASRAKVFIVGQNTSTFSVDGPLDVDAASNGQYDALADIKDSSAATPITLGLAGLTAGANTWLIHALETQLQTMATRSGTVDWSAACQTDGYTDLNGVSIVDLAAVTADTNSASVNNGAATANGGVAHLHVTAYSGFTSNAIRVEHSANDSTWATLGTFATVTAVTSERLVIAAGTTVNQYLRVVDDVTGSGSCTRHVSFARR